MKSFECVGVLMVYGILNAGAIAQDQGEMNEAAAKTFKVAKDELTASIERYRQRLKNGQLSRFDRSQHAWEEYLRAVCEFQSSGVSGGSSHEMIQLDCLETFTRDRLRYIQQLSRCEEGDLSCPAWLDKSSDRGMAPKQVLGRSIFVR
jgi:uncharacterized protein YecT (DUF1311 family)